MNSAPIWDPRQYLRHSGHRARPFLDLLARIPDPAAPAAEGRPPRIADLGCGPGNVTALLADRWPTAEITGFDHSPEMLALAEKEHAGPTPGGGRLDFRAADAVDWTPDGPYDLIVSNAALQWVPGHAGSFARWTAALTPGGTFAFQVPGNHGAPSHTLLGTLCGRPEWRDRIGEHWRGSAHVLAPADYLERLTGLDCAAEVWETTYHQLLSGEDPVLDWVKGTTLRPVLTELGDDEEALGAFLGQYRDLLREAYPPGPRGTVFPFRRIFAVATKPVL
ncbi:MULTISPECIES: trans-aconitate 2-methyltransferase [Streptomyces]|uniref:Trans-aconitate 2-methyltransferase n=1 Tax=Streptomyces tsukubensis (strain DSM 42081 / NBRC 108919 / NRRL 18488 / 9993) TaxID=1114943 RepID=I2MZP7_STRT9|nr:trans-aconitate 2-methyltransferase [Streptomyces tsukubensis]MYS62883.1 trans-aconitate 2-methyltransferase [Streptomyces sp. SID5473]AZK94488.1 trans-aconitate methyltransferase [Streptomyces tsukubensis]EIF90244.1 trans-aconitate 2-methyltransferase [Streptomyces tsukubensis NRRL18488]QKM69422.1 trans-aconitate 2-methyltransferase [Streptomyces tsukubensis NRRL18488]TAI42649.1 trans-aconitate 2-methyltransferase [Streptomyces tsukubensis]